MLLNLLLGLATGGAAYYFCSWLYSSFSLRSMNYIEVRSAQIEENARLERKLTKRKRLEEKLSDVGYDGDWTPLLIGVSFIYLLLSTALTFAGFGNLLGALLALPLALGGSVAAIVTARKKKLMRFEKQLLQVLTSVAGHLESGDVPQMAFQKATKLVENPLRGELEQVLASRLGSDSLSDSMSELASRYPSKAMRLLVAALAIDDTVGARLSPALRQAQVILERQFELAAEGSAEISQARGEFYAITGVMAVIALVLLAGSGGQARDAYTSPGGIIVIGLALFNYSIGVFRAKRVFSRAERGR